MVATAIRRYGMTNEERRRLLDEMFAILDRSKDDRIIILAARNAVDMDKVDVSREGNALTEKHHEVLEATLVLRAAMQGANVREQLAKLSDEVCAPLPIEVQHEIDEIHIDAANEVIDAVKKIKDSPNGHNGKS